MKYEFWLELPGALANLAQGYLTEEEFSSISAIEKSNKVM
jgi:hypothetical protein